MIILWWHWLVLGLVLAVAELATPGGFYLLFFGVAAALVGGLAAFDAAGPLWMQLLLFTIFSVGAVVMFRSRLLKLMQQDPQRPSIDTLVGEIGSAVDAMSPGEVGRVELRGAVWSARNAAHAAVSPGARCRVVSVDGLMLLVEPEGVR